MTMMTMMTLMTMMTTLNIKVVAEEEPGLGDEKINYQEYVVPAFLTQVGHQHNQIGADRGGDGGADYEDQDGEGIVLIH